MPNSIKTTCKALIIKQSLAGSQGREQLYAFKSRWRWCPAPAAARQPGDRSTRVRLVLWSHCFCNTRSWQAPLSQSTDWSHLQFTLQPGKHAPLGPGQEAHPGSSVSCFTTATPTPSARGARTEQRCLPQHIHQLCNYKLLLTTLIN